jgi:hypothetical protein
MKNVGLFRDIQQKRNRIVRDCKPDDKWNEWLHK